MFTIGKTEDVVNEFVEYLAEERNMTENSLVSYKSDVSNYMTYLLDNRIYYLKASKNNMRDYIQKLYDEGKKASTISRTIATIKCYYEYLINLGKATRDPTIGVTPPTVGKGNIDVLTKEQVHKFLAACNNNTPKDIRDKTMLEITYKTGLKVNEIIQMDIDDIDLENQILNVRKENGYAEDEFRQIKIDDDLTAQIRTYLENSRPTFDKGGTRSVFINLRGGRFTRQGFWKVFHEYSELANMGIDVTPYMLRHSLGVHMYQDGVNIEEIQKLFGHSDLTSTQVYARYKFDDEEDDKDENENKQVKRRKR